MSSVAAHTARPSVRERIVARAREFDLGPLLRLLEAEGYAPEDIMFESNPELVSSARLIETVTFPPGREKRVLITLNLGLLGQNGLLPSYFLAVAEQSRDPEIFFHFIRFFDHRLIAALHEAVHPETHAHLWKSWEHVKGFYFRMLGLPSTSTLHWLFQLHLPELRVRVCRHTLASTSSVHALRLGQSRLDGTAVLGQSYESDNNGFRVDVYADEERGSRGASWPRVVRERLEQELLPLLKPARIQLVVTLTVLERPSSARLATDGFLGFGRVGEHGEQRHTMVILDSIADG